MIRELTDVLGRVRPQYLFSYPPLNRSGYFTFPARTPSKDVTLQQMAPVNHVVFGAAAAASFDEAKRNGSPLLINVLDMFKKYDRRRSGFIDRSTFVKVLERINLPDVEWLMEASQVLENDEGKVDYNGFVRWLMFEDEEASAAKVLSRGPSPKPTDSFALNDKPLEDIDKISDSVCEELKDIAISLMSMALSLDHTHIGIANGLRKHAGTLKVLCLNSGIHVGATQEVDDRSEMKVCEVFGDELDALPGPGLESRQISGNGDEFDALARHRKASKLREQTAIHLEVGGFREQAAQILERTGPCGSMVDDIQEISVAHVKDKLAISYWRFCSGLRVYRSETVSKAARLICSAPVPGLGQTSYLDVFKTLTESAAWENHIYLFGGLVRDILRRTVGNDIDISFSAPAAELADTCSQQGYTCALDGDYILIGDERGEEYLEGMVISFNGIQPPEHADFSMNTLFYDFKNDIIIDKTGIGIPAIAANRCDLPCPVDRWKSWIEINGVRVCFRYYKFLLRGYEYKEDEFVFVVNTLLQFWTQQEDHTVEVGRIALGNLVSSESADKIAKLRQLVVQSYDMACGEGVVRRASFKRSKSKTITRSTSKMLATATHANIQPDCCFYSGDSWWQQGWLHLLKLSPEKPAH